ncbi:MAG TPA: amino acid adenylation domain-containing protein, partial [Segetibacter sp.]|nr:amino acid adenylation domain-containing protein [Segetibacter sp.]
TKDEIAAIKVNKEVIDYIKANKNELIQYLSASSQPSFNKRTANISSVYRLSGLQEGMLFHGLFSEAEAYIEQVCCNISNIHLPIFEESWNYVLKQHSILRSAFFYDEFSVAVQAVYKEVKLPFEVMDYSSLDSVSRDIAVKKYEQAERVKGFEFKEPPLMRISLIKLAPNQYRLVWTSHHLLFDGWSMPIILEELLTTYELLLAGRPVPFKDEDKYEDYIKYLDRTDKALSEDYWSNYLKNLQQNTLLPFINNTADRTKGEGEYKAISLEIENSLSQEIQLFAKQHRITVNTIMQGVWALLLHQYTDSKDVAYGVIVSGRPDNLPGVERRVGLYINTLPLYSSIDKKTSLIDWLQGLQNDQVKSRQHQYTALQEIKRWTGIQGDLFDSLLVFENYPVSKLVSANSWSLRFDSVEMHEHTNYPLTVLVNSSDDIHIQFSYNSQLLSDFYVNEIKKHFKNVLLQFVNSSVKSVDEVSLLTKEEKDELIGGFNNTQISYPENKTIVTLIEEQVQKTPEAVAALFQDKEITYKEINERANQLAHYLRFAGVSSETLVPICIERGIDMVVGILGILKAGGTYVPIDPAYPKDRIAFMLEDTAASIIVTNTLCRPTLPALNNIVNVVETDRIVLHDQPKDNLNTHISGHQLAYIIYTSGSTGKPKGVMIEHANVYSFICWCREEFASSDFNTVYASTSICFDLSIYEIFYPLTAGKQIRVIENGLEIGKFLPADSKVLTNSVPVVIDNLIKEGVDLSNVSVINMAGEPIPSQVVEHLDTEKIEVRNLYGPTEDTTYSTVYRIKKGDSILIGKPISNTQIFIVTTNQQLAPVGVIGEICIGGAGVARGYLNRAELTAEKFVENPFKHEEGSILYKTGDVGRWLPDGNIEYIGRRDEQVKIRGYRIELGEIETALQQSGLVVQSVVVAKEDARGNKRLVSYVVNDGRFNADTVAAYLKTKLPDYMIPSVWVELDKLPLTSNGKIDRKALPNPDATNLISQEYVGPKNETERNLVDIWQELLGIDKVSTHDNFFEIGGHSILAMQLISSVRRKLKLEASIKDLFSNPTIASFSDRLLGTENQTSQPGITTIIPRPANIPLSFGQERLWFIDQLEGSVSYHIPAVFRLKGELNFEALTYSLKKIIERHEILRTVIYGNDGQPFQEILQSEAWNIGVYVGFKDCSADLEQHIQCLISSPFDLSKDYMLRADLITLSNSENILVVTMHHIASDGWSLSVIVKEVVELYQAFVEQRNANLNALPIQYADYSIWQRTYLQGEVLDHKLNYWKQKLQGTSFLNLPTDYARPSVQSTSGEIEYFSLEKGLLQKLHSLGQQHETTLFMSLLAAFNVLLYRYTGQEDICVGTPSANRTYKELENLIGLFLNTLALRNTVDGDASFIQLLAEVKKTTVNAYEHQDVPFEKVVEAVVKERDLTRNALFQVMFILQNTPDVPVLKLGEVELSTESFEDKTSKFDLTFNVRETASGLHGLVHYRTDLFKKTTIQRLLGHFKQLLVVITEQPLEKVSALSLLSYSAKNQILNEFNKPINAPPQQNGLVDLFEEQALARPENIALVAGGRSLSYGEVNERANRLAHFLISQNVGTETIVPICIDRSFEMMIGVLAVLKSGAAYVPVDPDYPIERIGFMLTDTNARVVLSTAVHVNKLQNISERFKIIALDSEWPIIEKYPSSNTKTAITGKDTAYVLYTSGSTGKPKGVQIQHLSIAQHLTWFCNQYNITEKDSTLLVSSFSFDGAMTAIWPVLLKCGALHLPTGDLFDPSEVITYIADHKISYLKTLPGILRELVYDEKFETPSIARSLRLIILGGEKINLTDLRKYQSYYPDVTFSNHYGPTECTVSSTFYIIDKDNIDKSSLHSVVGKPVENATVYVVNEEGLLNPIGVAGEIWIGGLGVARGYLNAEDLTKEKFIADPFSDKTGARVYKTGDVGRWSEEGNLEFIGRKDEQVKVRGYRVEPGEIEDALQQSQLIREAVVVAQEDQTANSILVAYVVPNEAYDQAVLSAFIKSILPGYMIPSLWVEMEALPLSPNGKVDRKSLPKADATRQIKTGFQAPTDNVEQVIASTWQELLKIEQVSVDDNFFEIGGHSLLALRVVASIRKQLQTELSIKTIFLYPTIKGLAQHIRKQEKASLLPAIEVGQRPEKIPLSFGQERLWFMDKLQGSAPFHIPTVLKLKGKLRFDGLQYAFQSIQNRHEILRTVILENDEGESYQMVLPKKDVSLAVVDGAVYREDEKELKTYVEQLINTPFDLSKDAMIRAAVVKLHDDEHILVITMHHIASDGWSTSIFVKEMVELYECFVQERECALPPLPLQYADYAVWQRNYLKGEILTQKLDYWINKLRGVEPLDLSSDYPRHYNKIRTGRNVAFSIDKHLEDQIRELCKKQECTLFMALLAAFNILLNRYSGKTDICVGTPTAGRQHQEFENLIGLFVNLLALRTSINNDDSYASLIQQVKETTLEAYEHQEVPFEKIVDAVVEEREMGRSPIFQVMLVVLN